MRTRPDLAPVSRPAPSPTPSPAPPDDLRLDLPPDELPVRHDGTGTLVAVVTLFVVLVVVTLLAV